MKVCMKSRYSLAFAAILGILGFSWIPLGCAGFLKNLAPPGWYEMQNTKLEVVDTNAIAGVKKVMVVPGLSRVFDKTSRNYELWVLSYSHKMREFLISEMKEKGVGDILVPSDAEKDTLSFVQLLDPYYLLSRKEAKAATGKKPPEAVFSFDLREWKDCGNCPHIADSLAVNAVWVVWGRWHNDPLMKHRDTEYSKEKRSEVFHCSAQLFDARDGHLIAWTSLGRYGPGVALLADNASKAYAMVAGDMIDNFIRYRRFASSNAEEK